MTDFSPYFIMLLAFGAVTAAAFAAGQYFSMRLRLEQRAAASGRAGDGGANVLDDMHTFISTYFDEKRFQVEGAVKAKLRRDLVRAGYFRTDAINYYIFARLAIVVILPIVAYVGAENLLIEYSWYLKLFVVIVAMLVGVLGPDAFIARRQRLLTAKYRIVFPDLLDLMVVCIDAGLSLEAAFE